MHTAIARGEPCIVNLRAKMPQNGTLKDMKHVKNVAKWYTHSWRGNTLNHYPSSPPELWGTVRLRPVSWNLLNGVQSNSMRHTRYTVRATLTANCPETTTAASSPIVCLISIFINLQKTFFSQIFQNPRFFCRHLSVPISGAYSVRISDGTDFRRKRGVSRHETNV